MYDLQSYLGKMSAGMISYKKLEQAKYGKNKRKNKLNFPSQANFHIQFPPLTEDDLP
jgi:hypothetical protein